MDKKKKIVMMKLGIVIIGVFCLLSIKIKLDSKEKKVLKWIIDSYVDITDDQVLQFNELLDKKGFDYRVEFIKLDMLNSEEEYIIDKFIELKENNEQVDLLYLPINNVPYQGYDIGLDFVKKNLIISLNDFLKEKNSKELYELYNKYEWKSASINGENYGIPTTNDFLQTSCIIYNQKILDKFNISDSKEKNIKDIFCTVRDDVEKVNYKKLVGNDFSLFYINDLDLLENLEYHYLTDFIGVNYVDKSARVVNIFEEEQVIQFLSILHTYAMEGLINVNSREHEIGENNFLFTVDEVELESINKKDEAYVVNERKDGLVKIKTKNNLLSSKLNTFNMTNMQQCISSWSHNKEAAYELLKLVFTDRELKYFFLTDETYYYTDFLFGREKDNNSITGIEINESPISGFTFDSTINKEVLSKLQKISDTYKKNYFYIFDDKFEEHLSEYRLLLKENGIDIVINEMQKQLDEYSKEA